MLVVPPQADLRAHPLETARLFLSPVAPPDAVELFAAVDHSRAHLERWLPWVPFNSDVEASARYAGASSNDWEHGRACRFTIRERTSHRLVGVIGLEAMAQMHKNADLGYWLHVDAGGLGYMTEAGSRVLAWAFARVNAHRVRVAAATDNHASLGVIRRLGFHFEGVARQAERVQSRWLDHALFAMVATDPVARALTALTLR